MKTKVYYHDTDAGGVVYHGRYLNFLEEARTEFLDERGVSVSGLADKGLLFAVTKCTVAFKGPARYGETIEVKASLKKLSGAQIIFDQSILDEQGKVLIEAEVSLACLSKDFKVQSIPDSVKQALS